MEIPVQRGGGVEWSYASRPLPGETVSGDHHIVVAGADVVLVAVIDGLGHGNAATEAAQRAGAVLAARPNDSVVALVQECHRALRDTRGAAMTVVSVRPRERTATALGIGNVETVVVHAAGERPARHSVLLRGGVVGYQLPTLQPSVLPIAPGDVLVFATDGLREDFSDAVDASDTPPRIVERVLHHTYRGTDDALVLACKVLPDHEA